MLTVSVCVLLFFFCFFDVEWLAYTRRNAYIKATKMFKPSPFSAIETKIVIIVMNLIEIGARDRFNCTYINGMNRIVLITIENVINYILWLNLDFFHYHFEEAEGKTINYIIICHKMSISTLVINSILARFDMKTIGLLPPTKKTPLQLIDQLPIYIFNGH